MLSLPVCVYVPMSERRSGYRMGQYTPPKGSPQIVPKIPLSAHDVSVPTKKMTQPTVHEEVARPTIRVKFAKFEPPSMPPNTHRPGLRMKPVSVPDAAGASPRRTEEFARPKKTSPQSFKSTSSLLAFDERAPVEPAKHRLSDRALQASRSSIFAEDAAPQSARYGRRIIEHHKDHDIFGIGAEALPSYTRPQTAMATTRDSQMSRLLREQSRRTVSQVQQEHASYANSQRFSSSARMKSSSEYNILHHPHHE